MPLYDMLGKTINTRWDLQREISTRTSQRAPDFVFLAHIVDIMLALHAAFVFRSFGSIPFTTRLFLLLLWPGVIMAMLIMWLNCKTFLSSFYNLRGRVHQTWVIPRFGFQFLGAVTQSSPMMIVMEYLPKGDLRTYLDTNGPLKPTKALRFAMDIARGKRELELDFRRYWEEFHSSSSEKAFLSLHKEKFNFINSYTVQHHSVLSLGRERKKP
nr:protein ECERIFERUM 3-like [Ipomoea trifida]